MSKLITSLYKLPLNIFIDCICDNDYFGLIIEGEPGEAEIAYTWSDLLGQYSDALSDDSHKKYVVVIKEYHQAKIRYELANTYIELLNNYFSQGVVYTKWIEELNKLVDSNYKFDKRKTDLFVRYLENSFRRNKGNKIRYDLAKAKMESIMKVEVDKNEKPDRGYFTKIMVNLKENEGREIPDTISTYEFCVLVNKFKRKIEYMETKTHGRH